jgi:GDP-4-dehydro-6-deoxy-D-mannose reductase
VRFLVTGASGFAGRHLCELLSARGHEVHAAVHTRAKDMPGQPAGIYVLDVTDAGAAESVVREVAPDGVFHLAGQAFVPDSQQQPGRTFEVNTIGTVNVLAAVRAARPQARVLAVGSAEVYGLVGDADLPIDEACPFRPLNSYAASKAAADLAAYQWAVGEGLDVVRARPFNHTGAGQRRSFVCPDFASQLAEIECGSRPPHLQVGDLDVYRDFSDVRDVVAAYLAIWERGRTGEAYNICSGVARSVREMLDALTAMTALHVEVRIETARLRPRRVPRVVGSADKLRRETGWEPHRDWSETLASVLADCRARVAARRGD